MAGTGNAKFDAEFRKATKIILEGSEKVIRGVAIDIFGEVIHQSPVDTGRFKGNWQTTLTKPASGVVETLDPSGNSTQGKANAVIAKFKLAAKSLLLTNNLPYAEALASGHSKQRPSGWIESITANFQAVVDKVAKENEK